MVQWGEETSHKAGRFLWFNAHLKGVASADITRERIARIAEIKAKETSPETANRDRKP